MTIIMRSALVAWGRNPPPDLHHIISDHGRRVVTWAEVMRQRREEMERRLARKRRVDEWKPYKVWVAYFDQDFYGGWHAFVENRDGRHWIRRGDLQQDWLMDLFPLVLARDFECWMIEFARVYRKRTHHRKPLGVQYIWWNGVDRPRRSSPTFMGREGERSEVVDVRRL